MQKGIMTDFLLIGGGFGGLETAIRLRQLTKSATITLITPQPYLVYKPWLIYLPAQRIQFEHTLISLEKAARAFHLHLLVDSVTAVEPEQQQIHLATGGTMSYAQMLLATGATAQREIIPGAREHALFPCDVEDAQHFRQRLLDLKQGVVTMIIGWERPGPGLEYAGWIATYLQEKHLSDRIHLRVITEPETLTAYFGERAEQTIWRFFQRECVHLLPDQSVKEIEADTVQLYDGQKYTSDLTAVVGPLRGIDVGLPRPFLDEKGFIHVNQYFQSPCHPHLFAIGDAAALPVHHGLPKSMFITRKQAPLVAGNLFAHALGRSLHPFPFEQVRKGLILMPDIGGETVLVKQGGKLLMSGSWPLVLRKTLDRRYFKQRTYH